MDTHLASLAAATSSSSSFSSASSAPVLSAPLLSAPLLFAANATANATTTPPWAQQTAPLAVAGFCSCVALVVSCWHIGMHLTYYRNPEAQRSIVRILMIVPLYSMSSFVALVAEDVGLYFELVRDIYEAYVIYLFLCLIISFAGGDSICASGMRERGAMRHPWPLCCLPHLRIGARFLRQCKQLTLQFVVLKPIMAATSIIMLIAQKYYDAGYQTTLLIIYNVAYTLALGALGYFYMGCRGAISGHRLPFKFVSIKLVVFLTYWQGLVVELLPLEKEETRALNNFILCVEMMLFAVLHQRCGGRWVEPRGVGSCVLSI